jgi:hypothetical protein
MAEVAAAEVNERLIEREAVRDGTAAVKRRVIDVSRELQRRRTHIHDETALRGTGFFVAGS